MTKLEKLLKAKDELIAKMESIVESAESTMSDEQQAEFDAAKAELDKVNANIESCQALQKAKEAAKPKSNGSQTGNRFIAGEGDDGDDSGRTAKIIIPATARRSYGLKAFKGDEGNERAYAFGQFLLARLGNQSSIQWCSDHGISVDKYAAITSNDASGGYTIPTIFDADIAKLTFDYGVARKFCNVRQMTSDTLNRPKTSVGLTAEFMVENAADNTALTEVSKTYSNIQLVAKTLGILTAMTRQLSDDAIISIADDLMDDMARAFAAKEDACLFNGTGAAGAVWGGITGLTSKGIVSVSAATLAAVTLANLRTVISKVSSTSRLGSRWFINPTVFDANFAPLLDAVGGQTADNMAKGVDYTRLLGYPVTLTDAMDTIPGANKYAAFFGNLSQAADFGDRQQTSIELNDSTYFAKHMIAVKGIERIDINIHSIGAGGEPNPIAGLKITA
ncbi:MAG: phage major capsid protein [Sedimentisphaerales bacterium]|nr:phage major capsid protein [Sedimentisphaerales bacterium]